MPVSYIAATDPGTQLARSVTVYDDTEAARRRQVRNGGVYYSEAQAVVAASYGARVVDETRWSDEGREAVGRLGEVAACRDAILMYCEAVGVEPDETQVCIASRKAAAKG